MAAERQAEDFEHLVRGWSGRIHNLAFRFLGNRADAEDATQEIFIRLWERIGSYDPDLPFQPWIYRVATHSILNRIRAERRRKGREAEAPALGIHESAEAFVERRDQERQVHEALQRIPADERALLTLHYYGGLTQKQIAAVLDAPRTTVQLRIERALQSLRTTLAPSHSLIALPLLECVMRESTAVPVDDALVSQLMSIPGSVAAAAVPGTMILGGGLVSKHVAAVAVLLLVLGAGAGFLAGRSTSSRGSGTADPSRAEEARLTGGVEALQDGLAGCGRDPAGAAPRAEPATSPDRGHDRAVPPAPEEAPAKAENLDWSRFSQMFAANSDKMARSMLAHEQLDPADSATVLATFAEFMRICSDARTLSPSPFFDDRVLPDLAVALFGDAMGLTAEQRESLEESARSALHAHTDPVALERAGPLELAEVRTRISDELVAAAGKDLDTQARGRLQGLEPLARTLLVGSQSTVWIGMNPGPGERSLASQVLSEWKEAYALDERQAEAVLPLAERYALDSQDALRRRGLDRSDQTASEDDKAAALRDIVRLGVSAERAILAELPAEQRTRSRAGSATLVVLRPGSGLTKSTLNLGGL